MKKIILIILILSAGMTSCLRMYDEPLKIVAVNGSKKVFILNIDGTEQKQLSSADEFDCRQPSWSPDFNTIVYINFSGKFELRIMNADGSGKKILYETGIDNYINSPAFFPDGNNIAFGEYQSTFSTASMKIINLKTGVIERTRAIGTSEISYISTSSSRIVLTDGTGTYLWDLNTDALSFQATTGIYSPSWDNYSRDIVFTYNSFGLCRFNADNPISAITSPLVIASTAVVPAGSVSCWHPDGETVYFSDLSGIKWVKTDGSGKWGSVPNTTGFFNPQIQGRVR